MTAQGLGPDDTGASANSHASLPFRSAAVPFARDTCGSHAGAVLGLQVEVKQ